MGTGLQHRARAGAATADHPGPRPGSPAGRGRQGQAAFGLPAGTLVVSCYEAGRDGFWLHRYLTARGITNRIVDSSSIEVNRRKRRAKTDRIDAGKLVGMLIRYYNGETK